MSFQRYPKYKPSRVEWLGEVPEHWAAVRLRQLGRLLKGSGGSKEDIVDEGVPCVRYGDLYTTHRDFITRARSRVSAERAVDYVPLQHGDVLFAASGETFEEIGKSAVNLIDGEAVCGGDLIILRPDAPVNSRFLGYACDSSSAAAQKAMMGRGTTVKHIYPDELRQLALCIPPPDEQAAIVTFLDRETAKIDALVAEQERLIELLKEKRQAVISHAVTKGLNPNVTVKPSGFEWVGAIPAHWEIRKLKHVSPQLTVGIVVEPSRFYTDTGVPALRSLNVLPGAISVDNLVFITEEGHSLHSKSLLNAGDVVAVRSGQPGTAAVIPPELDGCNCIDLIVIRKPHDGSAHFLCWYLSADSAIRQFEAGSGGAIQQHFNVSKASTLLVAVPPAIEQVSIAEFLDGATSEIDALIAHAQHAITLLQERRTTLTSAAVTGQIDVRSSASPAA